MNILVIKLGALGDFILAQPAFAAIRAHHPGARITLLTTTPFVTLAEASPYFDGVWVDEKPTLNDPFGLLTLRRRLRAGAFDRVYDLQTSKRSSFYHRLFWPGPKPEWNGIARGCSHPDPTPDRAAVHSFALRVNQLRAAGITDVPAPDLSWMTNPDGDFVLLPAYALLVPGCAPHRLDKRWPTENFGRLAASLADKGHVPVVIGTFQEQPLASVIKDACPSTIDLTGCTTLFDIADLARGAALAVGNDTGPVHLIAAAGCPTLALFSAASDPAHSGPRGRQVAVLQYRDLSGLSVAVVQTELDKLVQAGAIAAG